MRLFGYEVARIKAQALNPVHQTGTLWGLIRESWGGAWQRNIEVDSAQDVLAFSGVFAPLTLIAADISKLRVKLVEEDANKICTEVETSPFLRVLRKPNGFQTRIQFWEQWFLSKLMRGNTCVLKVREAARGMVIGLYILDWQRVKPLVAENGDVYYELAVDNLSGVRETVTVPASEIIHDRWNCLWHPLIGISPLYAAGISATQGRRIQGNSTKFFDNMSRPSGVLTAPGVISGETAARMKTDWDENFSGGNIGRTAVLGDGLKYEAMTIPAQEAQLIEQLRWTVEDVARCFHMPLFKLGGPMPAGVTSIEALQQMYYNDCLHGLVEQAELVLDEGLGLPANYYTEFDIENLLRMDTAAQFDALGKAVGAAIMSPDEARAKRNLGAVPGGKYPYLQQQNYSLEALAKRDALADPFAGAAKPPAAAPDTQAAANDDNADAVAAAHIADIFIRDLMGKTAPRQTVPTATADIVASLVASADQNSRRVDATLETVLASALHTEQAQARVAKSMEEIAFVLASPVEPVYDEKGRLTGARRVPKIEVSK